MKRVVAGALVVGLSLIAVSNSPGQSVDHGNSDRFWSISLLVAQEVEVFDSIEAMATAADWVIEGSIVETGHSRSVLASDGSVMAQYAQVRIAVARTLVGRPLDEIDLEVFFRSPRRYEAFLAAKPPTETAIFFVRNKSVAALAAGWDEAEAEEEARYNMLVNQTQGVFRKFGNSVHILGESALDFTTTWEGRPFETLVEVIQRAGVGTPHP